MVDPIHRALSGIPPIDWRPLSELPDDMRSILVYVPGTWELPEMWHIVFRKRPGVYVVQDDDHTIIDGFTMWAELTAPVNRG